MSKRGQPSMAQGPAAGPEADAGGARRRGPSLAVRLLAAFVALALVFGGIVGWGLYRSRRALDQVRLLDEGYLRLALSTAELRAAQSILLTLLDRVLSEEDPVVTRTWVERVRQLRPERLAELAAILGRLRPLATAQDRAHLQRLETDVDLLRRHVRAGDDALGRFLGALDGPRRDQAGELLAALLERERAVDAALRQFGRTVNQKVADLARVLERDESRTFWMLLGLALVAAGFAVGIFVFVHSTVAPLRALERAVQAVARGDFSGRIGLRRSDEIGRLAGQFDRMTEAIRERDERLLALRQSEKLAALGRMAAHVTHEVRNPLSSIGLNAELLEEELRKAGAAEASRAMLGAIQREVDRLTRVTESYLSLARLPRPEPAPVDLGRVAREAVEFHRPEAEAAGARIAVDCADGLPEIDADAGQVRQVLANLLRNALEAVAERPEREVSVTDRPEREVGVAGRPEEEVRGAGRPEPEVRVAVRPERGGLEIAVRDTGPGVPEEARARLFEPFFTTKAKGTGIGLAASQQIAIAHGGTLTCDPPSGAGACFRLWLPGRDARRPSLPTPGPSGKE